MPQLDQRWASIVGLGLLLAGCGGGGSDQGASLPLSSPPAGGRQPHEQPQLLLTRAGSTAVTGEFLGQVETALYFAVTGVALANLPPGDADELSAASSALAALPCSDGGTRTIERLVSDAGNALGAGDSVRVLFSACREGAVTSDGEVRLDISMLLAEPASYALTGQVSFAGLKLSSGGSELTMRALLPVEYRGDADFDRYQISAGWLQTDSPDGRETLTSLVLDYLQDYPSYWYWLNASGTLTSDRLSGTVQGSTTETLVGRIGRWPALGRFQLSGSSDRAIDLSRGSAGWLTAGLIDEASGAELESWGIRWPPGFANVFEQMRETVRPPVLLVDPSGSGAPLPGRRIRLGAPPGDLAVDERRRQFYVTVPDRNEIVAIDLDTLLVDRRIPVAGRPQRLRMSLDGDTLLVTANAAGTIAALNLDDDNARRIDLVVPLNHPAAWDVLEYVPGNLLVTANPGSSGSSHVVDVDLATGNGSRVADGLSISGRPYLLHRPGDRFAYVSENFSPNYLGRLDLESPGIPIDLRSPHGGIDGTNHMALNEAGNRIVLDSGQVLSTDSLTVDRTLPSRGRPQFSRDFQELMIWRLDSLWSRLSPVIEAYDGESLELIGQWSSACAAGGISSGSSPTTTLKHLDAGRWAFLRDDEVCIADRQSPYQPPGLGDSVLPALPPEQAVAAARLDFPGLVEGVVIDAPAGLLYVSIPLAGAVHRISTSTVSFEQTYQFSGQPHGLDLSPDGSVLYVVVTPGAGSAGSVVRIATATGQQLSETPIDSSQLPVAASARSVFSVAPGRMLVDAGNEVIEVFGYDAPVSLPLLDTSWTSAGRLLRAPDSSVAYLSQGSITLHQVKLDGAAAWISAQNVHQSISPPVAISPDGSRLYAQSGLVLSTGTLMPAGRIGAGRPRPLRDGSAILVAAASGVLELYDSRHEVLLARYPTNCPISSTRDLLGALDDSLWLMIGADMLCAVALPEG